MRERGNPASAAMSEVALRAAVPRAASSFRSNVWLLGLAAAAAWLAAAVVTRAWPDVFHWKSTATTAWIEGGITLSLAALAPIVHRLGRLGRVLLWYGPWILALGVVFVLWEAVVAKLGWLPRPFFAPPQALLDAYVSDWRILLWSIAYSLRLWAVGFVVGVFIGFWLGVALGWSLRVSYWGMPVLKLIGPVPAIAWYPVAFYVFPTTFAASAFLLALSAGIPVAILVAAGVSSVNRSLYDVARTLGANKRFLILRVAIPAALPHLFVGLFMGLYYSFAVLVAAEMLGAKYGLGWYIQFVTGWSAYANMYAALVIVAILCSGIVRLLFLAKDRLLAWQKGII
jgi:NitT/TauT family transport system permease protein